MLLPAETTAINTISTERIKPAAHYYKENTAHVIFTDAEINSKPSN